MKRIIILLIILLSGCNLNSNYDIDCSPRDRIKQEDIHVYDDRVYLNITGTEWAEFDNTNSMLPTFDRGHNTLEFVPHNESDIVVCDIVSYQSNDNVIIHRVMEIDEDEDGWYAILKGDNNKVDDPGKVRFNQIKGVVVGILY